MSSRQSSQTQASDALIPALVLFGGLTLLLIGLLAARPTLVPTKTSQAIASPVATKVVAEATEASQVVAMAFDPAKVNAGENSYQTTCSACHGFNAMGIPGLGKPLVGSQFVNGLTDDQLLAFLQKGCDIRDPLNTTGVIMPARGGNPNFTDDKLVEIIAYIRSLNAAGQAASGAAPTAVSPISPAPVATDVPYVFAPLDLSGLPVPTNAIPSANAQPIMTGESLYVQSCSGCHGFDGNGMAPIAGSLSTSTLLHKHDGIGSLNFLTKAEPPISPLVEFPHPYRGGYPQLSDADLQGIIVYLYSLSTGK